jgi:endonuclease/exonuclease/phosphatase family metal-dependent hydrolase
MNLLTINVCEGGKLSKNIIEDLFDLITVTNADIIGIQETNYNVSLQLFNKFKLNNYNFNYIYKELTGNSNLNRGYAIFTKYDIININSSDYSNDIIIKINNSYINVINVHLHKCYKGRIPFGPNLINNMNIDNVIELINNTQTTKIINLVENNNNQNIILMGDFNNPSHLDNNLNELDIEWPVSKYLIENNFIDTFRQLNPNEKISTFIYEKRFHRSDYIYVKGNFNIQNSAIIDKLNNYWFTDHRAVLTKVNFIS